MWKDIVELEKPIIKYVKDTKNNKVGVLLSGINNLTKEVTIGWALCNSKKDIFDKQTGIYLAQERCFNNDRYEKKLFLEPFNEIFPVSIHNDVYRFVDRIKRYYQDLPKTEFVKNLINIKNVLDMDSVTQ